MIWYLVNINNNNNCRKAGGHTVTLLENAKIIIKKKNVQEKFINDLFKKKFLFVDTKLDIRLGVNE